MTDAGGAQPLTATSDLLLGDFHVHSTFSDDARSTLAENIAAAHAAGLGLARIGRVTAEAGTVRYSEAGRPRSFARGSFVHF